MKSKLLTIISQNGTGILKGNYRIMVVNKDNDILSKGDKIAVSFSQNETFLGMHFLLIRTYKQGKY